MSTIRQSTRSAKENSYHSNSFVSFLAGFKGETITLTIALFFILTLKYAFVLLFGWIGGSLYYPSIPQTIQGLKSKKHVLDSDNDGLPDVIESSAKGEAVYNQDGELIGWGTGTDPYRADSDFDGFPDGIEDILGSDPHNWFNPGYYWILLAIVIGIAVYWRFFRRPDMLKQYIKNEMNISGATSNKSGKFAYKPVDLKKIKATKDLTPDRIHDFRSSLGSIYFDVDEETAYGWANLKKSIFYKHFFASFTAFVVLMIWGYLDMAGVEVTSRNSLGSIDRIMNAIVKYMLGLTSLGFSIYSYRKFRRTDRRSTEFMKKYQEKKKGLQNQD